MVDKLSRGISIPTGYIRTGRRIGTILQKSTQQAVTPTIFSKFNDFTSSRSIATIYQNTTGNRILLVFDALITSGSKTFQVLSDSNSAPSTLKDKDVSINNENGTGAAKLVAIIEKGDYYKITGQSSNVSYRWVEYTSPTGTDGVIFKTFSNQTGSILANTTYQNTTGKRMLLVVNAQGTAGTFFTASILSDSNSSPSTTKDSDRFFSVGSSGSLKLLAIIEPNDYYNISIGGTVSTLSAFQYTNDESDMDIFSTFSNVTGSRSIGTVYQNTTGKRMLVVIRIRYPTDSSAVVNLISDSDQTPTTIKDTDNAVSSPGAYEAKLIAIVESNDYYKIDAGGSVQNWVEYS